MAKVYLALGSNVGDRRAHLRSACRLLRKKIHSLRLSRIYETKPVGYTKQDNFLNMAIEGKTDLAPMQLLKFTSAVEKDIGRVYRFRWGPREIDIDILFYDDMIYDGKRLEIPHPRLAQRDFVLRPLLDLKPALVHPVRKKTVLQLYRSLAKKDLSVIRRLTKD